MYCSKCGKQIADGSRFCPECGTQFGGATSQTPPTPNTAAGTRDQERSSEFVYPKNPPLSPHLSWINLLLAGLSHMIYGQVAKGIVLAVATIVAGMIIPIVGNLTLCAVSIVDSYKIAKKLAAGQPVRKWEWFPSV